MFHINHIWIYDNAVLLSNAMGRLLMQNLASSKRILITIPTLEDFRMY